MPTEAESGTSCVNSQGYSGRSMPRGNIARVRRIILPQRRSAIRRFDKIASMAIRAAQRSDTAAVFAVLTAIASEIPVRMDGEDRQAIMHHLVAECCNGSSSWVALDECRSVVGFLLGKEKA